LDAVLPVYDNFLISTGKPCIPHDRGAGYPFQTVLVINNLDQTMAVSLKRSINFLQATAIKKTGWKRPGRIQSDIRSRAWICAL
jgi:hypothetical protein